LKVPDLGLAKQVNTEDATTQSALERSDNGSAAGTIPYMATAQVAADLKSGPSSRGTRPRHGIPDPLRITVAGAGLLSQVPPKRS